MSYERDEAPQLIVNVRGCDSFYVAAADLTITDDDGNEYTLVRNEKAVGYLSSILEVTEFDVGSKEEADYVAALKAECDAYLGQRQP